MTAADVDAQAVAADKFEPTLESPCLERLKAEDHGTDGRAPFVFFLCADPSGSEGPVDVPAAARAVTGEGDPYRRVLDALFAGPSRDELQAGFTSGFSAATSGLPYTVDVDDGLAVVNLSRRFLDVEFLFVTAGHVGELVSTVGQFDEVQRVAVLVADEPLCRALEEC